MTFVLKSVEVDGAAGPASKVDFARAYQANIGQTISLLDVCAIRDRAQMILFRNDILARVDIPPQTLHEGALKLNVTVARISSVIVKGDGGPAVRKVQDYLEHLRGKIFDISAVQRYIFLASDIPGVHIRPTITPAPDGEGAVDLLVEVDTHPVSAEAEVQDYNSEALGRWGGLVRADLNGLTPFGDRTSVVLYSSLFDDRQEVIQGIEEFRLGDDGLTGELNYSYGVSAPKGNLAQLDLQSHSEVAEANLSYPIVRARATDLSVSGGIDFVDQRTSVGGAGVLTDDHLRVLFAQLGGRKLWRTGPFFQNANLNGFIQLRQGVDGLGASRAGGPLLSRSEGTPDAFVVKADTSLFVRWNPVFGTLLRGTGQFADHVLLAYEDFAAGNLTIVRGYDPSSLVGDKGMAGTAEGRIWPAPLLPDSDLKRWTATSQFYAYGFLEAARIINLSTGGLDRTVNSTGGGLNFAVTPLAQMTVTYAHPMNRVAPTSAKPPSDRVLFSLSARF